MLATLPPGIFHARASSSAAGKAGTASAAITAPVPLAAHISRRWPRKPNPVMSVTAWHSCRSMIRAAAALSCSMTATAGARSASDRSSFLRAVVRTPTPSGLVRMRASPGRAPRLSRRSDRLTTPVTANPYFGSGSSTVWPPAMTMPASAAFSAPPRKISPSNAMPSFFGKAAMFSAVTGVAPMA